ncbi:ATP-utilizing chromatin assembly and remodelling N-terminal-domain-containing protein [Halteromyces radiatus]|uniref:ATP-utilizing chromatin assembly and remodelling N-terminal-domain-containing protein n=1 Tax=Halteromyces radiatus TaxID=101107 RepID=UPI00221F01AA|nr:ATP-utilizing chromatin assembly and remodelling N-terminal-domain-containing protein [Halteromyces radiatus]KAI8098498.1 ATP-utilizing chromatin assembly and remodelling N-terminal-domain-containing protein [Halteromyces radiatus]
MPLLKRKQFHLLDPPPLDLKVKASKSLPVWYSNLTNEIFDDYPTYLERTTLYKRPVWQCESTGRSNLTYAEALESERIEKEKVQNKLSVELQKAVLERAQFQTTRLDAVVDYVYNYFVDRYVAGEQLECLWDDGILYTAKVLEAPPLDEQINDEVEYKMQLLDEDFEGIDDYIQSVPRKDIKRDRLAFSKNLLKKFLREATTKETYMGAPWIVNDQFAKRFDIDTTLPSDLDAAKTLAYSKSRKMRSLLAAEKQKEIDQAKLASKTKGVPTSIIKLTTVLTEKDRLEEARKLESLLKFPMEDLDLPVYRRNPHTIITPVFLDMSLGKCSESEPVPNPTGDFPLRPHPTYETVASDCFGSFLMVWSFLNVFSRPLCLSPFNLDDFESSLRYTSTDYKCEMVYEVIVALLNCIIRHRQKTRYRPSISSITIGDSTGYPRTPLLASCSFRPGQLQQSEVNDQEQRTNGITASDDDGDSHDDENDDNNEGRSQNGQKKNGLLNNNNIKTIKEETTKLKSESNHECLERGCGSTEVVTIGKDWDIRPIAIGNDREGWEDVMIGCINDLAIELDEDLASFDSILCSLVPRMNSTNREREKAYINLSLKDKLKILQLLVHAVNETVDIKEYMEECQEQLTELRRQKIDINREKKRIQVERNELEKQSEDTTNVEASAEESDSGDSDNESNVEENIDRVQKEAAHISRHESRQAILKRKQMEREEYEAKRRKLYHQQRQEARERNQELKAKAIIRKKLENDERQVQRKREQVERDMRKYSTLRFKPLGRDKFYNRYYYLDNIGSGFTHGSGKLFVQSPSVTDLLMMQERGKENMIKDEDNKDSTSTSSLSCGHGGGLPFICQLMDHQGLSDKASMLKLDFDKMVGPDHLEWWESFDDPDKLNALLDWLNPKGVREYLLKRELQKHLPGLLAGMKKHSFERPVVEVIRRSTRNKPGSQHQPPAGSWQSYTNKLAK